MKSFKLFTQVVSILSIVFLFACEGDKGEPGPAGPQGEQGIAGGEGSDGQDGADGSDGADGQDGNINSFYFQDGFRDYNGTQDVTIYNQADFFVENTFFGIPTPNSKNLFIANGDYSDNVEPDSIHALMRFNNLKEVIDEEFGSDICSEDFYINEAVIYLSGVVDDVDEDFLGVGFYSSESPMFDQNFVTWEMANETVLWDSLGGKELWQYNDPYFELIGVPNFGYLYQINTLLINRIPIYVPREVARQWICGENKGVLLSFFEDDFLMVIYSSENDSQDSRPMLYLNLEKNNGSSSRKLISDEEAYENWKNKSYVEKMKPFFEAHPQSK